MRVKIEITEQELKAMIVNRIAEYTGTVVDPLNVKILVKSKQNYKSEWEIADFRATYEGVLK